MTLLTGTFGLPFDFVISSQYDRIFASAFEFRDTLILHTLSSYDAKVRELHRISPKKDDIYTAKSRFSYRLRSAGDREEKPVDFRAPRIRRN